MKKLTMILCLLCLAGVTSAADPNDGLAVWGTTCDSANDWIAARLGVVRDQVEVGAAVRWNVREPWNEDVDAAGGYLIFMPDLTVDVQDPSPNNIFGDVIGLLIGKPYVGIEALIPTKGSDRSVDVNWLVGTLISLDKEMKTALVVEYATGQAVNDEDGNLITFGARLRF